MKCVGGCCFFFFVIRVVRVSGGDDFGLGVFF